MVRVSKFLVLVLLVGSFAQAKFVSVKVDGANFRQGPGENYKIFWDLDRGYPLQTLSHSKGWYRTKDYLGNIGWIYAGVVSDQKVVIIARTRVNLRYGPGTNYKKIGMAYNGQTFYVLRRSGVWLRVRDVETGAIAWVHRDLVWGARW